MASYELLIHLLIRRSAARELEALPANYRRRIVVRVQHLSAEPRPTGVEKLSGAEQYRIRQGDYRVLYEIDDAGKTVTIVRIGHRRDVYR